MNKHIAMLLCSSSLLSLLSDICKDHDEVRINEKKIGSSSEPVPEQGKYSLDWASALTPLNFAKCLDYVLVHFNGPKNTECCDGWQKSEKKYPLANKTTSPILLDLCGKASREVIVEMKIMGQIAQVPATLNDDLPKCKITPPTSAPPTTPTTTIPEICKKKFNMQLFFEKIKIHSKPLPELGKYSLEWAPIAKPNGSAVCLEKVIAYYNGPTKKCCDGWQESEPKYPRRYNDPTPIILDLCGSASRRVQVYFQLRKQGISRYVNLNDNLPKCKPHTTTTTPTTTATTAVTKTTTGTTTGTTGSNGTHYSSSAITLIFCFIIAIILN